MSLRDTIEEAKREAAAGRGASAPEQAVADDEEAEERTGFTKKSVTRAKPARSAAASVRVVSAADVRSGKKNAAGKTEQEMTKEEKKAARRARRDAEDRRASAGRALLNNDPEFKKNQRVWWVLLGVGLALTVISWVITYFYPEAGDNVTAGMGIFVLVCIVLAYICIIAAFIYDWRKVRPIRRTYDAAVASMSDKKISQVLAGDVAELEREIAGKKGKKNKKK